MLDTLNSNKTFFNRNNRFFIKFLNRDFESIIFFTVSVACNIWHFDSLSIWHRCIIKINATKVYFNRKPLLKLEQRGDQSVLKFFSI